MFIYLRIDLFNYFVGNPTQKRPYSKNNIQFQLYVFGFVCILWKMRRRNEDQWDRKSTRTKTGLTFPAVTALPQRGATEKKKKKKEREKKKNREDKECKKGRQMKYVRSLLLRSSHARGWCNKLHLDYMKNNVLICIHRAAILGRYSIKWQSGFPTWVWRQILHVGHLEACMLSTAETYLYHLFMALFLCI